jgi:hypothetical protein
MLTNLSSISQKNTLQQKRAIWNTDTAPAATLYKVQGGKILTDDQGVPEQVPSVAEAEAQVKAFQERIGIVMQEVSGKIQSEQGKLKTGVMRSLGSEKVISAVLKKLQEDASKDTGKGVDQEQIDAKEELKTAKQELHDELDGQNKSLNTSLKEREERDSTLVDIVVGISLDLRRLLGEKAMDDKASNALKELAQVSKARERFGKKKKALPAGAGESASQKRLKVNAIRNTKSQDALRVLSQHVQGLLGVDEATMTSLLAADDIPASIKGHLENNPQVLRLRASKEQIIQKLKEVYEQIQELSRQITELKGESLNLGRSEQERLKRLTASREKLKAAQVFWTQLETLLGKMVGTRGEIEALHVDIESAKTYRTLIIEEEVFNKLEREVTALNVEVCDALLESVYKSIDTIITTYSDWKKDFTASSQIRALEDAIKKGVAARKDVTFDLAHAKKDPIGAIRAFFSEKKDTKSSTQLYEMLIEVVAKLKEEGELAINGVQVDEITISEIYDHTVQVIGVNMSNDLEDIAEFDDWLVLQMENNAKIETQKSFTDEQQGLLEKGLEALDTASLEKGLHPVLELILSPEDLKKISDLETGKAVSLEINHIGMDPARFSIQKQKKTPLAADAVDQKDPSEDQPKSDSYLINGEAPYKALTGSTESLFGILRYFFASLKEGKTEIEEWTFMVS